MSSFDMQGFPPAVLEDRQISRSQESKSPNSKSMEKQTLYQICKGTIYVFRSKNVNTSNNDSEYT